MKTRFLFTIALAANCVREGLTHVRRLQVGDDEMAGEARYLVTGQISDIVASRKVKTYARKDRGGLKSLKNLKFPCFYLVGMLGFREKCVPLQPEMNCR